MAKSVDTNLPLSDHKNPKNPLKALNIFNEAKSRYPNYFHNDPIYSLSVAQNWREIWIYIQISLEFKFEFVEPKFHYLWLVNFSYGSSH